MQIWEFGRQLNILYRGLELLKIGGRLVCSWVWPEQSFNHLRCHGFPWWGCFEVHQGLQHLQLEPDWRWGTRLQHDLATFYCGIQHENHMNHRWRNTRRHCRKVGDGGMAVLLAAQCSGVWFWPGCCRSCLAAAWWLCGAAWHQAVLSLPPHFVTFVLYFSYCGILRLQYRLPKKAYKQHASTFPSPNYDFFLQILLLRLSHFRNLECSEYDELRFTAKHLQYRPSEVGAATGWDGQRGCRRRAGDLGVELGRSWLLEIFAMRRSWLSFTKFRLSFTELTLTSPPHLLVLRWFQILTRTASSSRHISVVFHVSTRSPFEKDGRTLRAHLQRQNLVKLACLQVGFVDDGFGYGASV